MAKVLASVLTKQENKVELIQSGNKVSRVLVVGVFHGDEPQGNFLINKYISSNISR